MNPVVRAVEVLKYKIPRQILDEVFQPKTFYWRGAPASIDEKIMQLVVRPRVLVDCNLVGGAEVLVDLGGLVQETVNNFEVIYRIPKDRTGGRVIMSVLSVGFGSASLMAHVGGSTGFSPGSVTPITLAGQAMMEAMSPAPVVSTAKISLIGENTVLIRNTSPISSNIYLRCIVAHDENMSHLQLRTIPAFTKLVELAVKSYVYNELNILIDEARLAGGQALGRFKEAVDEYRDAEQMYEEYLMQKWMKISFMNDAESMNRHIRMRIGPHR